MGWTGTDPVAWCRETKPRLTALFRGSVEALARDMTSSANQGGRMPVKTGNLQRSLLMSTVAMPPVSPPGTQHANAQVSMAGVDVGDTVYLGFQANYAARMEFGFVAMDSLGRQFNQSGFGFVSAAAANWSAIVQAEAEYVRNRVMSRG